MKILFYWKMAWMGIVKNKKMYLPYILTCAGMVMMYYIVSFLSISEVLLETEGGNVVQSMLGLGCGVIGIFALFFLFYTNSFLMRRRKKEFGLYNILGMGKWNLARILVWESLIIAVIAMAAGLAAGILFSKFAEMLMINILKSPINYTLTVELGAVYSTVRLFIVIFLLILLFALFQIRNATAITLLNSENLGEKPPRANYLLAAAGILILAAAYYIAVSIEEPVAALLWFFAAVILVIIATYLLFISGSVAVCRLLQKNKRYYYQTGHFVSIASMSYRMKRNGAGLASICILSTMVLVMLSSTVCLYVGTEDSLRSRYPRHLNLDVTVDAFEDLYSEKVGQIMQSARAAVKEVTDDETAMENILDYRTAEFAGYIGDGRIALDDSAVFAFQISAYTEIWQIFMISLKDYNSLMGEQETLMPSEVMIYTTKSKYKGDTIAIGDGEEFRIKKVLSHFVDNSIDAMQILPSLYLIVPDLEEWAAPLQGTDASGKSLVTLHWFYGFDLKGGKEEQISVLESLKAQIRDMALEGRLDGISVQCEGVARERSGVYGLTGGFFFLGILLGIVFLFAAVLIMYYKQISEGYEDQARFEIMRKVGMTDEDIKKSINSQILTVFFLPLLAAGMHLAFAFPMIYKLLILFSLTDLKLLIAVTAGCYLLFALCYILVYRITARAYYFLL